jgi:Protein of unknown function (DUF2997)
MQTLKFKVSKAGEVTLVNVEGGGTTCLDLTSALERRLGTPDESSRRLTDDFHTTSQDTQVVQGQS